MAFAGGDPRLWQPYADFLVGGVLMALPWGGSELAESAPEQMALLFSAVETYMEGRPRRHQPGLQPFARPRDDDDLAAESDSGAASFLTAVRPLTPIRMSPSSSTFSGGNDPWVGHSFEPDGPRQLHACMQEHLGPQLRHQVPTCCTLVPIMHVYHLADFSLTIWGRVLESAFLLEQGRLCM